MRNFFKNGFTLIEITLVAGIVTSLGIEIYGQAMQKGKSTDCLNNLKQIYKAIVMFQQDNDKLPDMKFFPSSLTDPRGIQNILKSYGIKGQILFCPSLPDQLNKYGTNYIWNDTANNKRIENLSNSWLLTEMTAVSKKIPPPHLGKYSVLYSDGHATVESKINIQQIE
ncbi:MAG: type II secretion system GspH family protein [Candidatus Omnitrophica bacterium]|nr:type II secretion system GspH family protein [Candidatus Omnitrophota bacterium]